MHLRVLVEIEWLKNAGFETTFPESPPFSPATVS